MSRARGERTFELQAVRVLLDALAIAAAVALAFPLRFHLHLLEVKPGPLDLDAHVAAGALWLLGVLGPMASHHLYDEDTLASGGQEMMRVRRSLLEGVALVATAVFLLRLVSVSRGWFALVVLLSLVLLAAERRAVRSVVQGLRSRGLLRRPAILVTANEAGPAGDPGVNEFEIVATVRPEALTALLTPGPTNPHGPPAVIVDAASDLGEDDLWRTVIQAGEAGASVFLPSPFRSLPADRLTTRTLGERTIVKVSPPSITGVRTLEKRLLDVAAALALLALMLVPMVLIALAILVSSGRPILYRQQRVGKNGRLFPMLKFRTMRKDAEAESGAIWATAGDPRRTSLGGVLRRLSLDELPQLWNVLRGHMSIVGPRPERPIFVSRFNDGHPWYRFRHRIRPGMTGLSQVRGLRGDSPLEPRVEADNWYIEHWSLGLDLRIAARTFFAMLLGRNAH